MNREVGKDLELYLEDKECPVYDKHQYTIPVVWGKYWVGKGKHEQSKVITLRCACGEEIER